ncbi:hypothetical protein [Paenibacillus sp. FSL H8-0122]|uniref:hypothetical protein n=1 Tax=Paenibacillus sp. FSL H8-0122 TaxID=2954510 RepID=UPI004046CF13
MRRSRWRPELVRERSGGSRELFEQERWPVQDVSGNLRYTVTVNLRERVVSQGWTEW